MTALKERAANLEIARIIACLIVIGCHTLLPVNIGTEYATSRVFLQCVFGDGVAVFWMLTGCFIFQKNYSEIVRRTLIKVFLPAMIFSILMFYFGLNSPLCTGQHHTLADYINLINAALAFNSPVNGQGHLWYIWVYVFIVIFLFPFTSLFVKKMDEDKKVEQKFIIIAILFVLLNDLSLNCFAEFSHHTIGGGIAGSILMMAGHILYKYRGRIVHKHSFEATILVYFAANAFRTMLQVHHYSTDGNIHFLYWYSLFGIICSSCLIVASLSMKKPGDKVSAIIRFISKQTFFIYLVHITIISWLAQNGIQQRLQQTLFDGLNYYPAEVIYMILIILIVFTISFIISVFANGVIQTVKNGLKRFRNTRN